MSDDGFEALLHHIKEQRSFDFTGYKRASLVRRVQRRMEVVGVSDYDEYLDRFVRDVKPHLISYDNYRVQSSNDLQDAKVAGSYFNNLVSVRRKALEDHNRCVSSAALASVN